MNVTRILSSILFLLISSMLFDSGQAAESPSFVPPTDPPRYLIVAEKNAATAPFDAGIRQAVFDLVYQGAGGEMVDGSVIEIWVVGEETTTRGFTPEMLQPGNHLVIAQRATSYLKSVPSQGEPDMPEFAEHIRNLASVAFETTVFFVSSPETRLDGTSVDSEVNEILAVHAERMTEEQKPFITTFRIQDGVLADYAVSESSLSPAVPPMPPSKVDAAERERMIADARDALEAEKNAEIEAELAAIEAAKPPVVPEPVVTTNKVDLRSIPDDEREGAIILRGTPKKNNETVPAIKDVVAAVDPAVDEKSDPETAGTVPDPVKPVVATVASTDAAETEDSPEIEKTESKGVQPADTPVDVANAGTDVDSRRSTNSADVVSDGVSTTKTNKGSLVTGDEGDPPKPAPTKFAVEPETWFTAGGLLVAGVMFFVIAALLVWVSMRRARAAAGPSFITRSMNDRKS